MAVDTVRFFLVCSFYFLAVCAAPSEVRGLWPAEQQKAVSSEGPNCVYCVFGGGYLQALVKHKIAKEEGRKELDDICRVTIQGVIEECHNLTSQFFGVLWDKIQSGLDNVTACNDMHCYGSPNLHSKPPRPNLGKKPDGDSSLGLRKADRSNSKPVLDQCLLCKAMASTVSMAYYYLNATAENFPDWIEYYCIALDDVYVRQCANLAIKHSKEMWKMILTRGMDGIEICDKLNYCNSTISQTEMFAANSI